MLYILQMAYKSFCPLESNLRYFKSGTSVAADVEVDVGGTTVLGREYALREMLDCDRVRKLVLKSDFNMVFSVG